MLIEGLHQDGSAAEDFGANVEDVAGIERAFADRKSGSGGARHVEVRAAPSALERRAPESVSSYGGCRSDRSSALLYGWN